MLKICKKVSISEALGFVWFFRLTVGAATIFGRLFPYFIAE